MPNSPTLPAGRGAINIVFDGPPGPVAGRFIEVEDGEGRSIRMGRWVQEGDYWLMVIVEKATAVSVVPSGVRDPCDCGWSSTNGTTHTTECLYPRERDTLHARIADLERQLAAAITHPLAVAAVKAYVASMRAPNSAPNAIANWKAQDDWERAGFPIHADNPHPETAP